MSDEPTGWSQKLWRASLTVLAATLALWLSVQILLKIWLVLVIAAAAVLAVWLLVRWWYFRS
ncbi:MAG: hypothetical protein ACYCX5_04545 [Coriobacteriia bacterium]